MTQSAPLVSIITPSFQQAEFLEATIQSVLKQNYPNLEYIIMDGGSTDGSVEIIQRYADRLAYWISEPDRGQVDAINRGFKRSTGSILAWLNSDDTYEPNAINTIVKAFADAPEARLVYGEGWYIHSEGYRIRPCRFVRETFTSTYMVNKDPILQQAAFWKRDLWEDVGQLNEGLNWVFDWEWFIRARQKTEFHYIPQFLANYRVHAQAKTRSNDVHRRVEQAFITKTYGKWWHPNHLVQETRIIDHRVAQATQTWPKPMAWLLQKPSQINRWLLEQLFRGTYTT